MVSDAPHRRGITVTMKYGEGYDATWVSFSGTLEDVRRDLLGYFNVEPEGVEPLSLHALVLNITETVHSTTRISRGLGGEVIGEEDVGNPKGADPKQKLIETIRSAKSISELKRLWANHKDMFGDSDVMAAYKERGRQLKSQSV